MKSYETVEPVPFGNYQLVERLAMGGMAEVYLARPTQGAAQERFVALKRILPNIAADDEFIAMFIDEAKIAGQLNHANVAAIFDLGKINASYFIAMEYVSGHDLRALWDRTRDSGQNGKTALPIGLACYATKKICEGLDYAHRKRDAKGRPLGIIHRDVSPQNILVSYEGDLKIIDFGIAKAANRMVRTQTGILKGKFAYMAPEQARGEPTDHRADIFAIGVILYELLTGERAFKAESDFALLEKVRKVDVIPPRQLRPEVPKDLERIVMKALQKDAADRYSWASALAADLDKFMSDQGIASSKEELGAFLQRTFKVEFQEEQRRLKSYRALFSDDDKAIGQTIVRSLPSHESERSADGTEMGDAPPSGSGDGSGDGSDFEHNRTYVQGNAQGNGKTHGSGENGAGSPFSDDSIDASEELSAEGQTASVPRPRGGGAAQSLPWDASQSQQDEPQQSFSDKTQLEPDNEPEPPPRAAPVVVARDEIARSNVKVVRSGTPMRAPGERSHSGPSKAPLEPPPLPERSAERSAPRLPSPERSLDRLTAPRGTPAPSTHTPLILAAAILGAVIGAVVIGIAWMLDAGVGADTVIVTQPRQAEVKKGDKVLCAQTPCAVALGPGAHELVFRAPGGEALSKKIDVKPGEITRVDLVLSRARDDLRLESEPPGAQVFLDGRALPSATPLTLPRLEVGAAVRLKLVKEGFQVLEVARVVDDVSVWRYELPTSSTTWLVDVKPKDALVTFSAPSRERDGMPSVVVGPNRMVEVRAERPGCGQRLEKLRATGAAEAKLTLELDCKAMARSGITIEADRRLGVRIDGIDLPKGLRVAQYPLPPGTWNVILRGGRRRTDPHTVEIRDGEFFTIKSELKP